MLIERDLRRRIGHTLSRSLQRPLGIPHHDVHDHWHADHHADSAWGDHPEMEDMSAIAPALVNPTGRLLIH